MGTNQKSLDSIADAVLVERILNGDQEAIVTFYNRFRGILISVSLRWVGSVETARDLAELILFKLVFGGGLHSYKPTQGTTLSSWICRTAVNKIISDWRSKKRHQEIFIEDISAAVNRNHSKNSQRRRMQYEIPDVRILQDQLLEQKEQEQRFNKFMLSIPETYRTPLLMRIVDELSYDQIAESLQIPMGTLKSRINRGIKLLKAKMNSHQMDTYYRARQKL